MIADCRVRSLFDARRVIEAGQSASIRTGEVPQICRQVDTEDVMQLGLKNRTAVITGASKGIGLAVARSLAAEGCSVHLVARDQATLEKAAAGIRADFQVSAKASALDLSHSESIARLMTSTGTPDILINNAGAIPGGDLQTID